MTSSTVDLPAQHNSVSATDVGSLRDLQQKLLRAVTSHRHKQDAVAAVAQAVSAATEPALMVYFERDTADNWKTEVVHGVADDVSAELQQQLTNWSNDACRHGSVQINAVETASGSGIAVTAPIILKNRAPDALATIYLRTDQSVQSLVVAHQLIAAHIALWQVLGQALDAESEAETTASLVELMASLDAAADFNEATVRLVNELQEHLQCQQVVLGMSRGGGHQCRLTAASGMAHFDKRAEQVRWFEAALNEAIVRGERTVWPATDEADRQGGLAHERLLTASGVDCVVSAPLRGDQDETVGAWLFLGSKEALLSDDTTNFIEASQRPIGSRLRLLRNAQRGPAARLLRGVAASSRRSYVITTAIACIIVAVLAIPTAYKIRCQCVLEPVMRRVVVAPYDGILKRAQVEPGAIVSADDLLAEMDGREIDWELAGLEAEYNRAKKERDATLAEDNVAESQRAKLEMKRLELKRELLRNRGTNLAIRSPIDGIVISGDLKKVEGAPLTVGQTLFEIAPLSSLLVELAVDDSDIRHVREGASVELRLAAHPWKGWTGQVANIFPRSEIRDSRNVFIAEVLLENADRQLRPGMKGQARIIGARHSLAWNLFHKPCDSLLLWLGW